MRTALDNRPGDPTKNAWTYDDLAVVFERSVDRLRRDMLRFEADGFPAPLPWSLRQKRWNPHAVLRWKERQERRAHALGPAELHLARG